MMKKDGTVYAEPSETEPINISYMRYVRYVLDNFATVADAIEGLKGLRAIRDAICKDVPITDGQVRLDTDECICSYGVSYLAHACRATSWEPILRSRTLRATALSLST